MTIWTAFKQAAKRFVPIYIIELIYYITHPKQKISSAHIYQDILRNKHGIEIGGPSLCFRTMLPIYHVVSNLDGANFSNATMWEGTITEGNSFNYYKNRMGNQFIAEATDLRNIKSNTYDFLLSSNCLEHMANPLKALEEWIRVIKPNGHLLLVLPKKECNFDHKRPITAFEHILADYKNNVTEYDLTHLNEILELHDLSRDPAAGNYENFKHRSLNNYYNRALHHHVFDMSLIENIFRYLCIDTVLANVTSSVYIALGEAKK